MPLTPEQQKIFDGLRPNLETLIQKVENIDTPTFVAGFVYGSASNDPKAPQPFIFRFGTLKMDEDQLVRTHYGLAMWASQLQFAGEYNAVEGAPAGKVSNPEEIADRLALTLLATPEGIIPAEVESLVQTYLAARRQEKI